MAAGLSGRNQRNFAGISVGKPSGAAQRSLARTQAHTSIDEYAVTKSPVAYLALIIHLCSGWLDDVTLQREQITV